MEVVEKTVEQLGAAFSQPTQQERWQDWGKRVVSDAKKEKKEEGKSGLREVNLKGRPDGEREWIEKVAEKVPENDKSKDSAKESRSESSEKEPTARTEERSDAKAGEKSASESTKAPVEPIAADLAERHWQGKLQGKEIETHISQVEARAGLIMDSLNSHPQKAQMEQGFRAIFAGRPPAQANAFFRDLTACLAEVPDPASVFRHITLQPQDREALRQCKSPQDLRAAIRTISRHYPASAPQPSPKPRAPRPPVEVGGRGAAGDDGTRGADGFADFSDRQRRRYAHAR